MGNHLQNQARSPSLPPLEANGQEAYILNKDAWKSQTKRVRACAISLDLLRKDIRRLNLMYVETYDVNSDMLIIKE